MKLLGVDCETEVKIEDNVEGDRRFVEEDRDIEGIESMPEVEVSDPIKLKEKKKQGKKYKALL